MVKEELTISKVEENVFHFTVLDERAVETGIEISMDEYSGSLKDILKVRKTDDRLEPLSKLEMKLYRKMTGKMSWLANSTRLDLSFLALQMSKNNQEATISDLRDINRVLNKVRERRIFVKYEYIRDPDDLIILGIGDASYKQDQKAVGGVFLFLSNTSMT